MRRPRSAVPEPLFVPTQRVGVPPGGDADVVIDQLRVGWYGAFAVELMAMGKPVIAYIREDDLRFVPRQLAAELPIVRATPDTVQDRLAELLADPAKLAEIGRRSRRFVERWHDPDTIARWLLEVYETPDRPLAAAASR